MPNVNSSADGAIYILFARPNPAISKNKLNQLFMRIAGITLPNDKRMEIALTAVFGIGRAQAKRILAEAKVDPGAKTKDLSDSDEQKIRQLVEAKRIEGDLKREVSGNIKRLKDIKSYRGSRHARGLPSRGQRSKTNSRTRRGNVRKTMGSGKKKVEKK